MTIKRDASKQYLHYECGFTDSNGNLINNSIDKFKSDIESGFANIFPKMRNLGMFFDAVGGNVLPRQLQFINPRVLEKLYPENVILNSGITFNNEGGAGASEIESLRTDVQGDYASTTAGATNGGHISVSTGSSKIKVFYQSAHSSWTKKEINQAVRGGYNLPDRILQAHDKLYQRKLDIIGLVGINTNTGLLNNPDFTVEAATGTAESLSGLALYNEIADHISSQQTDVANTVGYACDNYIMPTRIWDICRRRIISTTGTDRSSVLTALQENFPDVTFRKTFRADSIANEGDLTASRCVAYSASEDAMVYRLPAPLEFTEVDITLNRYQIASDFEVAGLDILEKSSGSYLQGL